MQTIRRFGFLCSASLFVFVSISAYGQANSWTNTVGGKWEGGSNWSLGSPSITQKALFITNTTTKSVTIDGTTSGSFLNTLTISNLTVSAPSGFTNTLHVVNAGTATPLHIFGGCTITSGGAVVITNSAIRTDGLAPTIFSVVESGNFVAMDSLLNLGGMRVNGSGTSTGTFLVTGGQLVVSNLNQSLEVGYSGAGQMTTLNNSLIVQDLLVGVFGQGDLVVNGGTVELVGPTLDSSHFLIGGSPSTKGMVRITDSQVTATNTQVKIGGKAVGEMILSNTLAKVASLAVGNDIGSRGTLRLSGGTLTVIYALNIGAGVTATGTVWLLDGKLIVTNSARKISIGAEFAGVGRLTVSNGMVVASNIEVGNSALSQGTLSMVGGSLLASNMSVGNVANSRGTIDLTGGTMQISSGLILGNSFCNGTGVVVVTGGNLFVTNAAHTGFVDVRTGALALNSGVLKTDVLILTNACGHFIHSGGSLVVSNLLLGAGLDADGDGLPNGWEQTFGLDPLATNGNNGANGDADGDGFTNVQEFIAGTNPADELSALRITAITREGNNIRVTWDTAGGRTNALQATGGGSLSDTFIDILPQIVVSGTGDSTTNKVDFGGATNAPSRFYRVRLVP